MAEPLTPPPGPPPEPAAPSPAPAPEPPPAEPPVRTEAVLAELVKGQAAMRKDLDGVRAQLAEKNAPPPPAPPPPTAPATRKRALPRLW